MLEKTPQKQEYIKKGAKIGDTFGWLGIFLPLPLFILVSVIFAGIGAGIGYFVHLSKS